MGKGITMEKDGTYRQNGYVLHFTSNDSSFSDATKKRMIETFFTVYPRLAREYNPGTAKTVYFNIDTAYDGVAATSGGKVVYNPKWFLKNPEDIDVVTHEVMHIVQDYGNNAGPWWVTEGIADYVRYVYGVNNEAAKWSLPKLTSSQKYDNSYRITARFFDWIERNNPGFVKKLDAAMRDHTWSTETWKQLAGKDIGELWAAYKAEENVS